jgi:hypothetical protein
VPLPACGAELRQLHCLTCCETGPAVEAAASWVPGQELQGPANNQV